MLDKNNPQSLMAHYTCLFFSCHVFIVTCLGLCSMSPHSGIWALRRATVMNFDSNVVKGNVFWGGGSP